MDKNYSALMAVYKSETSENLDSAFHSIFAQTVKTNDIVLVCDGLLTDDLYKVIDNYCDKNPGIINVIKKETNTGLGNSLAIGLPLCKNEYVMRCDSDDISMPNRAELELNELINNDLDIVSAPVLLFHNNTDSIIGKRDVPKTQKEIIKFSKKRCPFNHPSVMYKKSFILSVGNYSDMRNRQDYELWIRCLQNSAKCSNLETPLVYMRTSPDLLYRRRSKMAHKYSVDIIKYMRKTRYINFFRYLSNRFFYGLQYHSPVFVLKLYYKILHKR